MYITTYNYMLQFLLLEKDIVPLRKNYKRHDLYLTNAFKCQINDLQDIIPFCVSDHYIHPERHIFNGRFQSGSSAFVANVSTNIPSCTASHRKIRYFWYRENLKSHTFYLHLINKYKIDLYLGDFGFRHNVYENCTLLGYYVARSRNSIPTFRGNMSVTSSRVRKGSCTPGPLKTGTIVCPETSVRNYHCTIRNITDERRSVTNVCQRIIDYCWQLHSCLVWMTAVM
jgi:hypothetical protein